MSEVFRTPDERFAGLPGWPYEPRYAEVGGLRLARVDEGDGDPVLLLHGEPTWSYLYRGVIPPLLEAGHRVVAPDYPGFGRSDKPTDTGWYSYDRHVEHLTALVEQLDLRRVVVVCQDWGGPIGLRWAVENRDRVARLVILNTGLFGGRDSSEGLRRWLEYARAQTDLKVGYVVGATCGGLPEEIVAAYDAPFPTVESKAGALAFPRLVPTTAGDPGATEQLRVREELDGWDVPVTVAFSDGDPIFAAGYGEAWSRRLRNASFTLVEGAGHYLQEQRPEVVAQAILSTP